MRKIWLALIVLFCFYIFLPHGAFAQNSGWFLSYSRYFIDSWAEAIAIGDVNKDGLNDVVCTTSGGTDPFDQKLFVFTQNTSGVLNDPVIYNGDNGNSVDIADFNSDGRNDVVVSTDTGIGIYIQNNTGKLNAMTEIASQSIVRKVRAADLNGDGLADVVAIGWSSNKVDVFLQSGGVLSLDATYALEYQGYPDLDVGDLNDDGFNDILVTSGQGLTNGISILYQDPAAKGTFINPDYYSPSFQPYGCAIGDLNVSDGLGLNDVLVAAETDAEVFLQNAGGTLDTPPDAYTTGGCNDPVLVGDVNRDGWLDAIIASDINLSVLFQQSGGTLGGLETYDLPYATWLNPHGMAMGDINSDGMDDLVFANYNYGVVILWGWDGSDAIVIRNPGGGDSYDLGSPITIQWDTIGTITNVDISYSINGGANWTVIASNETNGGSYSWSIPYTPSDNCLVRVINSAGGAMGQSQWPFSIVDDGVDRVFVDSPNGGESLVAETTYNITWYTTGTIDNVKLEYSTNNGTTWTEIIASTPAADLSYTWTVPNEPSNQCLVRISDAANSSTSDTSDAVFTIYEPGTETITVTAPNGGESITGGTTYTITWTYTGSIASVVLSYSTDNGATWTTIGSGPVLNTGSYSWVTPNVSSAQCLVRVRNAANSLVFDQSNSVFSIGSFGGETVAVLSPNGGEVFCIGRTAAITWTTTGLVGNVSIQYSTNNGASWKNIVASTANDGSYLWTVPNTPSSQCLVRVQEAADGDPTDTSNAVFTIMECGASLSITSPQGGEAWQVGSKHDITWISGDKVGSYVKLLYSTNNGSTWITITSSTANDGSYTWTIPNTPSTTCKIKIIDASNSSISNISFGTFAIVSGSVEPVISLNRTHLYYGCMKSSSAKTPTQTITVNNGGYGTLKWQVVIYDLNEEDNDDLAWLQVSNLSGTESGVVKVDIQPLGMAVGSYKGAVKFTSINASNSPQLVYVTMNVYASQADADPFGSFDSPINGSTVMSSIPVTGWALDDIGIDKVTIWRNAVSAEGSGEIYIGDAVMVEGPRPDVEQAYPTYPMSYKGGWGYMLLTNMLPNGGNGPFTLHAYAKDLAGRQVKLGSKSITCDNAHAVKPFGAIDTPGQGGEATGSNSRNQGWVLTPMPNKIPVNGSTINVWIDGQNIGSPHYNIYRLDIAALFPGYANSNGAMGYFDFDTGNYESGVHTIQWVATDNAGNRDGIGSRYFSIQNAGYNSHSASKTSASDTIPVGKTHYRFSDLLEIPLERSVPIKMSRGYKKDAKPSVIPPDKNGITHITVPQDERIVLDLSQPAGRCYFGYMKVDQQLRPLPPGASIDAKKGILYWQPGPASLGKYQLVFILLDKTGKTSRKEFTIEIVPKYAGKKKIGH
jgi:hypothetical protein